MLAFWLEIIWEGLIYKPYLEFLWVADGSAACTQYSQFFGHLPNFSAAVLDWYAIGGGAVRRWSLDRRSVANPDGTLFFSVSTRNLRA